MYRSPDHAVDALKSARYLFTFVPELVAAFVCAPRWNEPEMAPLSAGFQIDARKLFTRLVGCGDVFIPDTVVFSDGRKHWLYSNANGKVCQTTKFSPKTVLSQIGNRHYEADVCAVVKEPAGGGSTKVSVLSTRALREALPKLADSSAVVQRFIKAKGVKASVLRTHYRRGRPGFVELITNDARCDDESVELSRRFCTGSDGEVLRFKLVGRAAADAVRMVTHIVTFLEGSLSRKFVELVADFAKDDFDALWLLRFASATVESPAQLAPGSRNRRSRGTEGGVSQHNSGLYFRKCRFCSCMFSLEQLRYRMTTRMIIEVSHHLRRRLTRQRFESLLGSQGGGDLGLDASRLYHAHRVCRTCFALYENVKRLLEHEAQFARTVRSIDAGSHPHVYDHRRQDRGLRRLRSPGAVSSFSQARLRKDPGSKGVPRPHHSSVKMALSRSVPRQSRQHGVGGMPRDVILWRMLLAVHELHEIPASMLPESNFDSPFPPPPTFLRLSALGQIYDVPVDMRACGGRFSDGSFALLPVRCFKVMHFFTPPGPAPLATLLREEEDGVKVELLREHPRKHVFGLFSGRRKRVFYGFLSAFFVCVRRHLAGSLRILAELDGAPLSKKESHRQILGAGRVHLSQFRSSFVKLIDTFVPLGGAESGGAEVKISIGIEQTKGAFDSQTLAFPDVDESCSDGPKEGVETSAAVRYYRGVYLPAPSFVFGAPLPPEWIAALSPPHPEHVALLSGELTPRTLRERQRANRSEVLSRNEVFDEPTRSDSECRDQATAEKVEDDCFEEEIGVWCVHVAVDRACNVRVAPGRSSNRIRTDELAPPEALHLSYSLFGIHHRSCVAELDGETLYFDFSKKHFVRASRDKLLSHLQNIGSLRISLVRPLSLSEANLVAALERVARLLWKDQLRRRRRNSALLSSTYSGGETNEDDGEDGEAGACVLSRSDVLKSLADPESAASMAIAEAPESVGTLVELPQHLRILWSDHAQQATHYEVERRRSLNLVRCSTSGTEPDDTISDDAAVAVAGENVMSVREAAHVLSSLTLAEFVTVCLVTLRLRLVFERSASDDAFESSQPSNLTQPYGRGGGVYHHNALHCSRNGERRASAPHIEESERAANLSLPGEHFLTCSAGLFLRQIESFQHEVFDAAHIALSTSSSSLFARRGGFIVSARRLEGQRDGFIDAVHTFVHVNGPNAHLGWTDVLRFLSTSLANERK